MHPERSDVSVQPSLFLVDNGRLVENEPKCKSIRNALCDRDGEIMVIMSQTPESFHDIAQTLIYFGVNNAIYLVGGVSCGYYRDDSNQLSVIYERLLGEQEYEKPILWVRQ